MSARATVGAVALAVTALTATPALAEGPAAPSATPAAASAAPAAPPASATPAAAPPAAASAAPAPAPVPAATPLAVRPSHPVELAPEPRGLGLGSKLGLGALVLLGGAWLYVQHRGRKGAPARKPALRIAARTGIGVRSELLIVEVEGQRLLLGVTPGSVQRLAVLPDPDAAPVPAPADLEPAPEVDVDPGFLGALRAAALQSARARRDDEARDDGRDDARDDDRAPPTRALPTREPFAADDGDDEDDDAPRAPAPPPRREKPARPVWRPAAEAAGAAPPPAPPPTRPRRIAAVTEPRPAARPAAPKDAPKDRPEPASQKARVRGRAVGHDEDPLPGQASLPLVDVGPSAPARAVPRGDDAIEEQARGLARIARGA